MFDFAFACVEKGCKYTTKNKHTFKSHMLKKHGKSISGSDDRKSQGDAFPCAVEGCDKSYGSSRGLREHTKSKHSQVPKPPSGAISCEVEECERTYSSSHALREHMKSKHPDILKQSQVEKPPGDAFPCTAEGCEKSYGSIRTLREHTRSKHPAIVKRSEMPVKPPFICGYYKMAEKKRCNTGFKARSAFLDHLRTEHNLECPVYTKTFDNEDVDEFKAWKKELELKEGCRSHFIANKGNRHILECHRSGEYRLSVSSSQQKRRSMRKGTDKIGFSCSAYMFHRVRSDTGKVEVTYCPEHYGHEFEPDDHEIFPCLEEGCGYITGNKCTFRSHMRKKHSRSISGFARKPAGDACPCPFKGCDKTYGSARALREHKTRNHPEQSQPKEQVKPTFICGYYMMAEKKRCYTGFKARNELLEHLRTEHNLQCPEYKKSFENEDEFKAWKKELELKEGCRSHFVANKGKRHLKSTIENTLDCHRSGEYLAAGQGKRGPRMKGSNKIGFTCSAYINFSMCNETGKVDVTYCPEHYSHDFDQDRCPNPDGTRKAQKRYSSDGTLHGTGAGRRVKRRRKEKDKVSDDTDIFSDEPRLWAEDFDVGDVATCGGRIYFAHPTEGICSVQHIALDQPYVARVWLEHAPNGGADTDDFRQLDFSEFSRLGFRVEYIFRSDKPMALKLEHSIDQNQSIDQFVSGMHVDVEDEDVTILRPEDDVLEAIESIETPSQLPKPSIRRRRIGHVQSLTKGRKYMQQKQQTFTCSECSFEGTTEQALRNHTKIAHGDGVNRLPCNECGKTFLARKNLEKHFLREHGGTPPCLCEECGGSFRSIAELQRHTQLLHASVRDTLVQCSYCDQTFTSNFQCAVHMNDSHSMQMEAPSLQRTVNIGEPG